jgi:Ca2+-binding RTX toxin-like protein
MTRGKSFAASAAGALVLAVLGVQGAEASSVATEGSTIIYRAAPGEPNHLVVNYDDGARRDSGNASYFFGEYTGQGYADEPGIAIDAGAGCHHDTGGTEEGRVELAHEVECSPAGVNSVRVELADGDDRLSLLGGGSGDSPLPFPASTKIDGGGGADNLDVDRPGPGTTSWPADDEVSAGAGDDQVQGGSLVVLGEGNDSIEPYPGLAITAHGGPGNDEMRGTDGDDVLTGGEGRDRFEPRAGEDQVSTGPGHDTVIASGYDPATGSPKPDRDQISCGSGRDTLETDPLDVLASDCGGASGCSLSAARTQRPTEAGLLVKVRGGTSGCEAKLKAAKLKIGKQVFVFVKRVPARTVTAGETWRVRLPFSKAVVQKIKAALKKRIVVRAKAEFDLGGSTKSAEMRIK